MIPGKHQDFVPLLLGPRLDVFLDRPRDRELFDLAPKEVSKNEAIED